VYIRGHDYGIVAGVITVGTVTSDHMTVRASSSVLAMQAINKAARPKATHIPWSI
jgi:hypothetical protein